MSKAQAIAAALYRLAAHGKAVEDYERGLISAQRLRKITLAIETPPEKPCPLKKKTNAT